MRTAILFVASLSFGFPAYAQSSKDYALMAKRSWSEFVCAALATTAGKKNEHEKLFKAAFDHGKTFIEAAKAGKVERSDILEIVPWGFSFNVAGPSTDFALGVIWSFALQSTDEGVREDENKKPVEPSLWETRASHRFLKENCALL